MRRLIFCVGVTSSAASVNAAVMMAHFLILV
jgi:hypothetical protein